MGLNIVDINVFYSTFTNLLNFFSRFLHFFKYFFNVFYIYASGNCHNMENATAKQPVKKTRRIPVLQ